ncbi:PP2C-like domain-containing protein CG9801 isoform X1 [Euwallacea fornicatus]|uniref:PP2C-like domain-containing protein CG9801 isoform X1 n=1 Tax=Euwallacea fornicatus TaxID=995702 RepID=UPI00338FB10A
MPSLRKKVSSYLRQLSFYHEPRRHNINENAFVTKYLQGQIHLREGPPIIYGEVPTNLPNYELGNYESGSNSVVCCYSGPNGGLTTVKRTEKHLSVPDDDIDFIDNPEDELITPAIPKKSPKRVVGQPIDNTTMVIKVAGNEYCVTNRPKRHSKSHSLGSISDFGIQVGKTKIDKDFYNSCDKGEDANSNSNHSQCIENAVCDKEDTTITSGRDMGTNNTTTRRKVSETKKPNLSNINHKQDTLKHHFLSSNRIRSGGSSGSSKSQGEKDKNHALSKSQSEGNPFQHKKRGKIIQVQRQQRQRGDESTESANQTSTFIDDSALPAEWNRKSDFCYGISDSLYDKNQATKLKNGDPIADCFGIITRNDSAILAVADGVNWGEKASIAAKSAVHGSLHYLNKIIFNDTKPFENLTNKTEEGTLNNGSLNPCETANLVSNTREVFVSLLRAFNCAHDLILENEGMLTTLTIAVVLPLRQSNGAQDFQYVCCVCNVGDSLAYVYSQKNGIRELTKGSHDVNRNRDMRDALGALGPVDGINPELSNLTLSITTLHKGDIVLVASDGLTDNFDPNVCRFTVNKKPEKGAIVREKQKRTAVRGEEAKAPDSRLDEVSVQKPPVKPPRRSKPRSSASSASHSERSNSSVEKEIKNSSGQSTSKAQLENPLKAHFMRENSLDEPKKFDKENNLNHQKAPSNKGSTLGTNQAVQTYRIMKAKTSLDLRSQSKIQITRNEDGVPYVTPIQRYELQLLLMEDILRNGISGRDTPVTTARKLCENLLNFTMSITAAKRRTLEDQELYFDNRNGLLVEVSDNQKKIRRKRALEKVQPLPGKLDHVTVVAWNVGNVG